MKKVAVLGGIRTPFVRSFTHYRATTNQEILTAVLSNLVEKKNLKSKLLGDVAAGAVIKHAADWNLTRECVLGSGLHPATPGYNVQRACGTSLETTLQIALKITSSQIDSGIAAGVDTNSDAPAVLRRQMGWKLIDLAMAKTALDKMKIISQIRPKDFFPEILGVKEPRTGLTMGEHCELMVQEFKIPREEQDQLAYESHQKAAGAYAEGFYNDLIFDFKGIKKDAFVRADTSLEKLGKLKPVFEKSEKGTLTAGNSTPLTDGGAAVLLSSEEWAEKNNQKILAYFKDAQATAVDFVGAKEGLLMAPTVAVKKLLERNNLKLTDFDFYEVHEAFAGQVLCTFKAWEDWGMGKIDRAKLNVKGGSLALGHPFGATGARAVTTMAKLLSQKQGAKGLISICTAGGMGVAAIMESP